jgi:hypothetical protein
MMQYLKQLRPELAQSICTTHLYQYALERVIKMAYFKSFNFGQFTIYIQYNDLPSNVLSPQLLEFHCLVLT